MVEWQQPLTEERNAELAEKIRRGEQLEESDYPYIVLPVKVYRRVMVDMGEGRKQGYTHFRNSGYQIVVNGKEIGGTAATLGVGSTILRYQGEHDEFEISAKELWLQVAEAIGFEIPEEIERPAPPVEKPKAKKPRKPKAAKVHADVPVSLFPVDYDSNSMIHGGHLKDIPEPHIYMWPGCPRKRRVKVSIMRHYGYGPHYYLSIREDDNPVWDGRPDEHDQTRPRGWCVPWSGDDDQFPGRGRTDLDITSTVRKDLSGEERENYSHRYQNRYLAKAEADRIVQEYFSDYDVEWDDYTVGIEGEYYAGKHGE